MSERDVERALSEGTDRIESPTQEALRALARSAAAHERPAPAERRRLTPRWAAMAVIAALVVGSVVGFGFGNASSGRSLGPVGEFGAFVVSGDAVAAPAVVTTRTCAPAGAILSVHVLGNKQASFWAQPFVHPQLFLGIPDGRSFVALWTLGSETSGGPQRYGWITAQRLRFAPRCRISGAPAPSKRDLGPAVRTRDGWAIGARFECVHEGRLVIQTERTRGRIRLTAWLERSRELVAVAETRPGHAWARVAKRCAERQR